MKTYAVKLERVFRATDELDAKQQMTESFTENHILIFDYEVEEIEPEDGEGA